MIDPKMVADHYTCGDLLCSIRDGIERLGKTAETITEEELALVDEFHIGGRMVTRSFLDQMAIGAGDHVLDIGCGIGGASRFAAQTYGCQVTGIDLTEEYVTTGNTLSDWLQMTQQVTLVQGDVRAMHLAEQSVDKAFMLHVGMNISDKAALAQDVWRVLRPGGMFGVYDVMGAADAALQFPVPWASVPEASSLGSQQDYRHALLDAGFEIVSEQNCRERALGFFERLKSATTGAEGPPPLGLHILMGREAPIKMQNMIENIHHNRVVPVEIIARKL